MTYDPRQVENQIESFYHCGQCLESKPDDKSPQEWSMNEVGATKLGIQVWCKRHDSNVMHMDLEGQKHPAYIDRKPSEFEQRRREQRIKEFDDLSDEQKEKIAQKQFDRRCSRVMHTMRSMMGEATDEFFAMGPLALAEWVIGSADDKSDEAVEKNLQEFIGEIREAMKVVRGDAA